MSAYEFTAPFTLATAPRAIPAGPAPGEAIVRTRAMGVCGTDTSAFAGKFPFFEFPRIPGHELGLEILAVGEGVHHLRPGERACLIPYRNDPDSAASRAGRSNCCPRLSVIGVHEDGGLRDQPWTVPARLLQPGYDLPFDLLALVEPLAIGRHAVQRAQPRAGELALVIGAGPIGLAAAEFLRLAGCRTVLLDLARERLDFARTRLGFEEGLPGGDGALEQLRAPGAGEGAALVVDATGHAGSMSACFDFADVGARVVFVGVTGDELRFPHAPVFHRRELSLFASRNALPRDFADIVDLIRSGRLDPAPWITHRLPYAELPQLFAERSDPRRSPGLLKLLIEI